MVGDCVVYYESIKRELNIRLIYECRCDERLKAKTEGSTRLTYTGLRGGMEHLKIMTRLIDERFESVMGECAIASYREFTPRYTRKGKKNFHGFWESCLRVGFLTPVRGRRGRWGGWPPDWGG